MNEIGISTVQKPNTTVAARGPKQVSSVTFAECDMLVTVAMAVNAIGNSIPPILVFSRKSWMRTNPGKVKMIDDIPSIA